MEILNEFLISSESSQEYVKLHDELLHLQQVANDHKIPDALFLECLSYMAPKLTNADHLEQWFKAYVNPAINSAGHRNDVVTASRKFFFSVLCHGRSPLPQRKLENGEDAPLLAPNNSSDEIIIETSSQLYFYWLLDLYHGAISKYFDLKETGLGLAERKRFILQNAKDMLAEYGSNNPYEFFTNISKKGLQPENRLVVLSLASTLIGQYEKTDFSVVATTPFPDILYNCLLYDNSSTTIQMCINVLSMYLPHLRRNLNLPKLLVIFGRAACWYSRKSFVDIESALTDELFQSAQQKRTYRSVTDYDPNGVNVVDQNAEISNPLTESSEYSTSSDDANDTKEKNVSDILNSPKATSNSSGWKILNLAFGLPDIRHADISPLFSVLYGLFPYNFLEFSNNPTTYLNSVKYSEPLPDNWDSYQIKVSMKTLFSSYSLNPFMTLFTKDQELNDLSRWDRMGSGCDLVVHCLGLHIRDPTFCLKTEVSAPLTDEKAIEDTGNAPHSLENLEGEYNASIDDSDKRFLSNTISPSNNNSKTSPISLTDSKIHSPVAPVKFTTSPANSKSSTYMSPLLKSVDELLEEHHLLYKRLPVSEDSNIPENLNLNDLSTEPFNRFRKRSSTLTSPFLKPSATTQDAMNLSPLLIPQVEPSRYVTPLTVSSPLTSTLNMQGKQRSDNEPEPLRLSPLSSSNEEIEVGEHGHTKETEKTIQQQIQKQQLIGSTDPSILFYQRELMLVKNEFDFIMYLERHSQYQHAKLLEERAKDAIYNDSVGDLIVVNQALRKKVYTFEQMASQAQRRMKTIQNDRQKYESSLLQRNRDMRTSQQELSRKLAKLEIKFENCQRENDQLYKSIIQKEAIISQMEFKVAEFNASSALAESYKKALNDSKEKVEHLKSKTENFLSPEEADQVSNFLARIKELTSARDAAEHSRRSDEFQFRRQIANLQARIRDYQEKQRNPSNKLMQSFEDFKKQADEQYAQLSNAHKDLAERYTQLNDEFRKYITAEEVERNKDNKTNPATSFPKSLLGYDISPDSTPGVYTVDMNYSGRSSTSASTKSARGGAGRNHSPQPQQQTQQQQVQQQVQQQGQQQQAQQQAQQQGSVAYNNLTKKLQGSQQHDQQVRIRGRGGVQSTIRKKDTQPSQPRSGTGTFRGFM